MKEKTCKTCWFYRPVGYIPAGLIRQVKNDKEMCGLENDLLPKERTCSSWMSEAGTAPTALLTPEAEKAIERRNKREKRKRRKNEQQDLDEGSS